MQDEYGLWMRIMDYWVRTLTVGAPGQGETSRPGSRGALALAVSRANVSGCPPAPPMPTAAPPPTAQTVLATRPRAVARSLHGRPCRHLWGEGVWGDAGAKVTEEVGVKRRQCSNSPGVAQCLPESTGIKKFRRDSKISKRA